MEVQGTSWGVCAKPVIQALQSVSSVGALELDIAPCPVRLIGKWLPGSAPLVLALTAAGQPARQAITAAVRVAASSAQRVN